jgi:hypothetical protein
MAQEHGDIFAGDDALNLERFLPKPAGVSDRPGPQELRGIAERSKFISREGKGASPPAVPLLRRGPKRTGRTVTVTLKTTPEHSNRFYALAEAKGWLVGETFERALDALEGGAGEASRASESPG